MTIDTKTLPEHPFTISYNSSSPGIASSDSNYTISFEDSLTNNPGSTVTTDSMPINIKICLLYTSPSPRDGLLSRMPSSA